MRMRYGVSCGLLAATVASGQTVFQPLPLFTGVRAITPDGNTAVGDVTIPGFTSSALRWDREIGTQYLASFPGQTTSGAWGITPDRSTIVGITVTPQGQQATRWVGGAPHMLGRRSAYGVSSDGQVIVGEGYPDGQPPLRALQWDGAGVVSVLPTPAGTQSSGAWALSADGMVAAGFTWDGSGTKACAWIGGAHTVVAPPAPYTSSYGWNVSSSGNTVVGFANAGAPGTLTGFRWTASTGAQTIPGFHFAYAANHDGSIIVGRAVLSGAGQAMIWTAEDGSMSLQSWLQARHGLSLPGWTLTEASAITPDGNHIGGVGIGPNGASAWIVSVPAPSTGAVLLAVAWRCCGRRRKCRAHAACTG